MRELLQNPSLLQHATTLVTKCVSYYKIRRYYKMPQPLLQNPSLLQMPQPLLQNASSLQNAAEQCKITVRL